MTNKKTQVKAIFHFTDGDTHESILSIKSGKCEDIMTSITDQVGKYNIIAFLDKEATSNQFIMVRENVKMIEFVPLEENDCEEKKSDS